jgi:hypothetical protein
MPTGIPLLFAEQAVEQLLELEVMIIGQEFRPSNRVAGLEVSN